MTQPAAFGAKTDHWGLIGAGKALENKAKVIASSEEPIAQNREDAQDENGDIAASAYYGNTGGTLKEVSVTYQLISGQTVDLSTLNLGELEAGSIVDSLTATTQNGDQNPTIEISGRVGCETVETPATPANATNKFELPNISIVGAMRAQGLGFTVTEGKLTGSSLTASIEIAQDEDGEGEPVAHGVSGGTGEVSADIVRVTDAPTWTVDHESLTETKGPGEDEGQANWHTTNATAAFTVERETTT